ncbi:MAG TPA: hydroxymethylbilane synthase [Candidatus Acidoferrales bacterium]|nr:hydroxymethylbilane synthase [Candidatus Acidoferrales bacterium]
MTRLRIGTRGSALALWQAHHIADRLAHLHGVEGELVRIRTAGDRMQSAPVAQMNEVIGAESGGKGIFIKELEDALLAGTIDLAVHSMKDVPTEIPDGLAFPAITRREDPRDCLISRSGRSLKGLPAGARIGTSSLRRQAQLRHNRPDLEAVDLRGNVDTRLKKLDAGEFDAVVLAVAGVNRLGAISRVTQVMNADVMLPAVGQGALGIETRADDAPTSDLVAALDDAESRACVTAERALLHELQGGCQVPLGAWAQLRNGELHLEAAVFSADGREFIRREARADSADPAGAGKRLGQILLEAGADRILRLAGRTVGR